MREHALEGILFDFHGTLVHGGGFSFEVAMGTLLGSLADSGIELDAEDFRKRYRAEVRRYFDTQVDAGREQHNTVWIAAALRQLGHELEADDLAVTRAADAYFDRFAEEMTTFAGVEELLASLHGRYRLGLLSNFTDARPVRRVLERDGLADYFDVVVISAELGRRKPLPSVFEHALEELGSPAERTLFVGDDPSDDIQGAKAVGMRTAWVKPGAEAPLLRWMDESEPDPAEGADITVERVVELIGVLGD